MEHRCSTRRVIKYPAFIDCYSQNRIGVVVENVSLDGAYVTTGNTTLALYAPVTLCFRLNEALRREEFRLEAMVVRTLPGAAGLLFIDSNIQLIRALYAVSDIKPAVRRHVAAALVSAERMAQPKLLKSGGGNR